MKRQFCLKSLNDVAESQSNSQALGANHEVSLNEGFTGCLRKQNMRVVGVCLTV